MNEIVKYNNQMNKISFTGFSKIHMDLFMALCSKMKGKSRVRIRTKELKEIIQFEKGGNRDFFYELDMMTDQLQRINGKIVDHTPGQRKFVKFAIFTVFEYYENDEWLEVEANERFAWLLNEFEQYTAFELEEFIELKSKYSKGLYRILKQWRMQGWYIFHDLEEFRRLMDIPESYTNKRMMDNCVNIAVKEIGQLDKSFKGFKCTPEYARKRGKPLDKLIFTWQAEKTQWNDKNDQIDGQSSFADAETFEEYMKGYQGEDKPNPVTIKIAKDIEKGKKNKTSSKKKNAFHNFTQRDYGEDTIKEMEKILLRKSLNNER